MIINNVNDLMNELIKNNGKVILPPCMLVVNDLSIDNLFYSIYMDGVDFIRNDEDNYEMPSNCSKEDFLIEFCDINGSIMSSIPLNKLKEIEIAFEYDENGYIKG